MAVSIVVASFIGVLGAKDLAPMEVQILPVSRQELARTLWWASTILLVGIMTTGKVIGTAAAAVAGPIYAGPEAIWLSASMDFLAAGTVLASFPLIQLTQSIKSYRVQMLALLIVTLPLLGMPFVPYLVRDRIPLAVSDAGSIFVALITVGAACTALAYLLPPRLVIGANRHAVAGAMASQRRSGLWLRLNHVTGLRRMAFKVWLNALVSHIGTPLFFGAIGMVTNEWSGQARLPWTEWLDVVREFGFLPFEAAWRPSAIIMLFMFGGLALQWDRGAFGTGALASMRHLRTLPLSTRQLNVVLLGLPLLVYGNLWLVLAAFHVLLSNEPFASLRLTEFFGLYGVDCLNKAAQLRLDSRGGLMNIPTFLVLAVMLVVASRTGLVLQPILLGLGAAGLISAWFMNLRTLTTQRKIYAPQKYRPFGMEIPGQS